MPTLFIANMVVIVPKRFAVGDTVGDIQARILNDIQHRRVVARLRYLLERGELAAHELQAKAHELCELELVPHTTFDDEDENNPVLDEALSIARELITARMAKEGLLPPKGLDNHARALVNAMPEIQERARKRIEARYVAAANAMETTP